jgi:type II secretory pathway component GspD/PulD (secretin)
MLKKWILAMVVVALHSASASGESDRIKMEFKDEFLTKVIEVYAHASHQKVIVDPRVEGKVSIFIPDPVSSDEAFNQLSSALALNGYGFSRQGDTLIVMPARALQRSLIEVTTTLPAMKPERMATYVYSLKNQWAGPLMNQVRIFSSRDGEMVADKASNQLIFTDWTSNLARIDEILKKIDVKPDLTSLKPAVE